jgi:hypothetical protein
MGRKSRPKCWAECTFDTPIGIDGRVSAPSVRKAGGPSAAATARLPRPRPAPRTAENARRAPKHRTPIRQAKKPHSAASGRDCGAATGAEADAAATPPRAGDARSERARRRVGVESRSGRIGTWDSWARVSSRRRRVAAESVTGAPARHCRTRIHLRRHFFGTRRRIHLIIRSVVA